jgi:tetratricopeptide (TPR) repeat protein
MIDEYLPSLYNYRGVALHNAQRLDEASEAFRTAVRYNPSDSRSWINLGESLMHVFKIDEAIDAYSHAVALGEPTALSRQLRAMVGVIHGIMIYFKFIYRDGAIHGTTLNM